MLEALFRLGAEFEPLATWMAGVTSTVIITFLFFVGIALRSVLRAPNQEQRQVSYKVFRDLLDLFRRGANS